jgi:phage host-nuclease inhibitor protein Gam
MNKELLDAIRLVMDLKAEKKKYNTEINDQIKDAEARLKQIVADNKE